MAFREKSGTTGATVIPCPRCRSKDQGQRHVHFLQLPSEHALVGHLRAQYDEADWGRLMLDGTLNALLSWRRSVVFAYSDLVGDDGAPLPVWRAWVLSQQAQRSGTVGPRQRAAYPQAPAGDEEEAR